MKRLLVSAVAVAAVVSMAPKASAQAPFADVPRDHWAYDAVNTLAQRGLVIGYPDGTFGGKRAMTRYEFAVVIARMIPQLEEYIRNQVAAGGKTTPPPDLSNFATKDDIARLQRLIDEFGPELQMLQVDVAGLKRDMADLRGRVGVLEDEVGRVKFSGEMNAIARLSATDRTALHNGIPVIDMDGRVLNRTTNLLEASQMLYDMDLGITARVTRGVTANALLNIGNYAGGFAAAPFFPGTNPGPGFGGFPYGTATTGSMAAEITPWKAYIEAPIAFKPVGLIDLQAGKTSIQFTPYTLKMVDYDSYTNLTKTDNGDVIFSGAKAKLRFHGVDILAYAGTHGNAAIGSGAAGGFFGGGMNSGAGFPVVFGGGRYSPTIPYTFDQIDPSFFSPGELLFPGLAFIDAPATQSAGIRGTIGTPLGGTLGLTYLDAGINNNDFGLYPPGGDVVSKDVGAGSVWGADLALNLTKGIGFTGEYSNSNLYSRDNDRVGRRHGGGILAGNNTHSAYDGRIAFSLSKLAITAGYKRIEPYFVAPGAWGNIGGWKNPTNIQGPMGTVAIPLTRGLAFAGSAATYRSIVRGTGFNPLANDGGTHITHWTAGFKFALTSATTTDLGVETVYTRPNDDVNPGGNTAQETFYNLGIGTSLASNTSVKLLYQIVDYRDRGAGYLFGGNNARGSVAVGQFQVKF